MTGAERPGICWRRSPGWNPTDIGWRIAVLFMVGSALFAAGSLPAYATRVDGSVVGVTFVVGALFFTSAGASQLVKSMRDRAASGGGRWTLDWSDIDVWSSAVQFVGTLLFNVSTIGAMLAALDTEQQNRIVWRPDVFGSVAFLVASHLAWLSVCRRVWAVRTDDENWWSAALNYIGSIFFMLSAIAAIVLPTTGEVLNITIVNAATFIGAVCFFVGAYLLLPASPRCSHRNEPA
ncbi:hypothetical protein [Ilumatobacter sp.]|uniref:hypothetical protein n=1 Tax=Ilumatobacter sp. TaxID=1967498 RepID=UPI003C667D30